MTERERELTELVMLLAERVYICSGLLSRCAEMNKGDIDMWHGILEGVGPDTPTVTNDAGAKQSACEYRPELIPPLAILQVSRVLKEGAEKYGIDNWRAMSMSDHICHALTHVYAYLAGDKQDDHLGHAATRLLFALECERIDSVNDVMGIPRAGLRATAER